MEWKKYTIQSVEEALGSLRTTKEGLSQTEARRRVLEYGKNSLQTTEHFLWKVVQHRLSSWLSWIFIAAAAVTSIFGNFFEAGLILCFLLLNLLLEIYQAFHSEKASRIVEHFLLPKARVFREGTLQDLPAHFLVPGDILTLHAGDTFPADVRFIEAENTEVNETLINSDRTCVEKNTVSLSATPLTLSEARNIGFAGTVLVRGQVVAMVIATGASTALGDIAYERTQTEKETPFEKNIRNFSRFLVKLLICGLLLVFGVYFLIHGEQVAVSEMLIFTLALAVAVVPEAFPAITALALSRGAVSLAKKKLVVKRLSAIEDLGSIEILCTDKTGILTENTLTVTELYSKEPNQLLRYALLACRRMPSSLENLHDAFDMALWKKAGENICQKIAKIKRLQALEFDSGTRLQTVLVEDVSQNLLIVRGAPEEIFRRAEHLDSFTRKTLQDWIREAGARGERVLAVATKVMPSASPGLHIEGSLIFQGLIAFLDPIKADTKTSVALAKKLGVAIKLFSGDSKETVGAVGYATGLAENSQTVVTGNEFEVLSLPEQIAALETHSLFARFSPGQKAIAVQLLQKTHTVGVIGGGIADSEMLQRAHVGMVAEEAGNITRETADILLLQKDLRVVIEGIQESRRVFANILKYLKITLASNFGNFYAITLAGIFLPYLPLLPLQILLLNFLTDIPMLAIATDRVDHEKLERPKDHSIHAIIVTATLFGIVSSFFDLTIFKLFSEYSASTLQTVWFIFSVLTEILLLYSLRSRRWFFQAELPSPLLLFLSLIVVAAAIIIPYTFVGLFFGFEKLAMGVWMIIFGFTASYFVITEILKRWYYLHNASFSDKR